MSLFATYRPSGISGGGGGGGTPGGISGNIQYNSAGAFAGDPAFNTDGAGNLTLVSLVASGAISGSNLTAGGHAILDVALSSLGNLTDVGTDGIVITGGTGAVVGNVSIAQQLSDATHNGYLSSVDWSTFNNKQPAGSYITDLTGDVTASGPGSAAATLATVNGNVGSFGSSTSIPSFTVNAKGLITAASGNVVIAPAGTLTGTTLNATVVSSSLTSVGTLTSLTISGQLTSTVTTGTAPFVIASTTLVPNLYVARSVLSDSTTTNANLTGVITSVGNATSIASQTGTGTKFVVDNTPTLITPNIGAATGSSLSVTGQLTSTVATGTAPLVVSSTTQVANLNASTLTGLVASTTPTASTIAEWDANKNLSANNLIDGFTTTATAAGTTTMTIADTGTQVWTGSTTQTVKLPTTSVVAGGEYTIINLSSGVVTVQSSGANTILALAANTQGVFVAQVATPTTAANWSYAYSTVNNSAPPSGTVTSVAMTVPAFLSVAGSPVTTSGTLAVTLANENANTIFAGPASGAAATPTFRAQVAADRPLSVTSQTTTYSVAATDDLILCSGSAFTVTLPAANAQTGRRLIFKKTDSSTTNIITISRAGSDMIDGNSTVTMNTQYESFTMVSDGVSIWQVEDHRATTPWTAATSTINGSTSNPTKGTVVQDKIYYRRNGQNLEMRLEYAQSAGGTAGSGTYLFPLQLGATADGTLVNTSPTTINGSQTLGTAITFDGTSFNYCTVELFNSTNLCITSAGGSLLGSTFVSLATTLVRLSFSAVIPISGWSY